MKWRQKSLWAKTTPRRLPVSFDLLSRATRDDMELRRLHEWSLLSYQRRNGLIDAAHQLTRMPPTMYWHWLLARGIGTASFSYFFVRRSKVRRRLEIRPSVSRFSAPNPEQSRKFHSRSRKRNGVERIRNIDKRTRFLSFRCLRKQREREARPTGRSSATQFHERPPRKTATKYRIKFRNATRLKFDGGAVLKSFKAASDETCIEFSGLPREGNHSSLYSPFVRLQLDSHLPWKSCQGTRAG